MSGGKSEQRRSATPRGRARDRCGCRDHAPRNAEQRRDDQRARGEDGGVAGRAADELGDGTPILNDSPRSSGANRAEPGVYCSRKGRSSPRRAVPRRSPRGAAEFRGVVAGRELRQQQRAGRHREDEEHAARPRGEQNEPGLPIGGLFGLWLRRRYGCSAGRM